MLKVQDGCSHGCSYCIVPRARGKSVSRSPQACEEEMRRLVASGHGEVVISGINLRHYGRDLSHPVDFWGLVERLDATIETLGLPARLRISSLDPAQLDERALHTLAACTHVAPHLHLSLQSMEPTTLAAMGRSHYSPERVLQMTRALKEVWPLHALSADILVGFPGETDEHFATTLEHLQSLQLTSAHVFGFSPRPGTQALALHHANPVTHSVVQQRTAAVRTLVAQNTQIFLGKVAKISPIHVVAERQLAPHLWQGTTEFHVSARIHTHAAACKGSLLPAVPYVTQNGHILANNV